LSGLEIAIVALIVFALLVPVAILTVMILRLRVLLQRTDEVVEQDHALEILRKRYASGEIDEDEFLKRKRVLESSDP
jgi:uncharacterized membrane protein